MPRLSAWFIRAALLHLGAGFTLGLLMLWNKGLPLSAAIWRLLPAHVELLIFGWTLQLVLGMAYWILPRFKSERGRVGLAAAAFLLLNAGVLGVALSLGLGAPGWVVLAGRAAELLAAVAFAAHAWPRIKPMGA